MIDGFWIIGGSSTVGTYTSRCVLCRKLQGLLSEQKMADSPADRLDFCPIYVLRRGLFWMIKERMSDLKRYGVLFTCLASRAIHLEMIISLTTDSFINVLRQCHSEFRPPRFGPPCTNPLADLYLSYYSLFI